MIDNEFDDQIIEDITFQHELDSQRNLRHRCHTQRRYRRHVSIANHSNNYPPAYWFDPDKGRLIYYGNNHYYGWLKRQSSKRVRRVTKINPSSIDDAVLLNGCSYRKVFDLWWEYV